MNSVQTNRGLHIATDSKANGNCNGITGEWVVDPFCDGNGSGKNSANTYMMPLLFPFPSQCEHLYLFALNPFMMAMIPLPLPSTSYEQISNVTVAVAVAV